MDVMFKVDQSLLCLVYINKIKKFKENKEEMKNIFVLLHVQCFGI